VEIFNNLRKIILVVEYNGERYFGFQWQKDQPTIQDELEKAILKLTGEERRVIAACRTDTGVHARGQVISFRTGSALPVKVFVSGLNHYLPRDISVLKAGTVSARFNVMKDAVSREYRYLILNRRPRASLGQDMYYHVTAELDAGPTAPAQGLCLMKVIYADNSEFKYENLCT